MARMCSSRIFIFRHKLREISLAQAKLRQEPGVKKQDIHKKHMKLILPKRKEIIRKIYFKGRKIPNKNKKEKPNKR